MTYQWRQAVVPGVAALVLLIGTSGEAAQASRETRVGGGALQNSRCDTLAARPLQHARITTAALVEAGAFSAPGSPQQSAAFRQLPAFCRVAVTLTPGRESHIETEIWMPVDGWNGKFLAVGNGGWAGTISFGAMAEGLRRGYTVASNDTGHQDQGARFTLSQDKLVDFAYRAMHEMTVQSRTLIAAFYAQAPRLSYYQGCSTGGRQGMMAAQRYPEDFDAIVAGAPVYNQVHLNISQTALQVDMLKNADLLVPQEKVSLVAKAAVSACDARDGVTDGIINNPAACAFDPAVLACKAGDASDCLTPGQVASARQLYAPVKTSSGQVVYPGRSPGVETGWAARIPVPGKPMSTLWSDMPRFVGHRDADWDAMSFDLDQDLGLALKHGGFIEASDPNLAAFKARGGKLLLWHGWADPGPAPENTINYHVAVAKALGGPQDDWMRLFLMPGVAHCGGGVGPDQADFLGAMEQWREGGIAPARITASRSPGRAGRTPMTRPLCPYPQVARYTGSGSTDEAANFVCAAP